MDTLYVDNHTHTLVMGQKRDRIEKYLFSTRAAVFDGTWSVDGYGVRELCRRRLNRGIKAEYYYSTGLKNLMMAVVNSFEFITCHGLSKVFGVNRSTAYRAIKELPHLKNRGTLSVPCLDGMLAVFHSLMKNAYVASRLPSSVLPQEEYHFLKANEAAGRIIDDLDQHNCRLRYLMEGHELPMRTEEMLQRERNTAKKSRNGYRIRWVGAIPFIKTPSKRMKAASRIITFCGHTGVALGNYKQDKSIYREFITVPVVSPMFPERIDQDVDVSLRLKSVCQLPSTVNRSPAWLDKRRRKLVR